MSSSSITPRGIQHSPLDRLLISFDTAVRTVWAEHAAARPCPQPKGETQSEEPELTDAEKRRQLR